MGFLIALFLFVSTFGSVRHYMQSIAIAQEMYSWDHPNTEIDDDVTGYDNDDHDDDDTDIVYEDIIGTWELYYAELNGGAMDCDVDSEIYETLTFKDDHTVVLKQYSYGDLSLQATLPVTYSSGFPIFTYDDSDNLPESIAREVYYVIYAGDNEGLHMTVLLMFYNTQGFIEGGYTLMFTRP